MNYFFFIRIRTIECDELLMSFWRIRMANLLLSELSGKLRANQIKNFCEEKKYEKKGVDKLNKAVAGESNRAMSYFDTPQQLKYIFLNNSIMFWTRPKCIVFIIKMWPLAWTRITTKTTTRKKPQQTQCDL